MDLGEKFLQLVLRLAGLEVHAGWLQAGFHEGVDNVPLAGMRALNAPAAGPLGRLVLGRRHVLKQREVS